ncbi:MAG TPA: DUF2254 domain-containing protein, partial [Thermoanaerobaculia bacterium]|nr:DUF2254 domain-containing protein [Thermoanaerobaculia bacterium]
MSARFVLRQLDHDVRASLFLRPTVIAIVISLLSVVLVELDQRTAGSLLPAPLIDEPSSAQAVFGTIAGSVMAVVSIVYSVLVMSVTLASMQFSPRIVSLLLRDPVSQNVLGIFTGTFLYSLLALRGVRTEPPFVPSLTLLGAIALAITTIAALIYFIDHMAKEIQANHLIAGAAHDAFRAIESELPDGPARDVAMSPTAEDAIAIHAIRSGYLQLVDVTRLIRIARSEKVRIDVVPMPGDFVAEGATLARISASPERKVEAAVTAVAHDYARAFDLGPTRTLQQDVAFGLRLIVDIGVKAISPAINDPSTCSTCIDHLGALLRRLATRSAGALLVTESDVVLVALPRPTFKDLVDLAFNQLRQYGRSDLAVANRIMRALNNIAEVTTERARLEALRQQGSLVVAGLDPHFMAEDRIELQESYEALRGRVAATLPRRRHRRRPRPAHYDPVGDPGGRQEDR